MLILMAIAMGASVGSFINVAVDRLPNELSIVRPRSYCDSCKRPLANLDMVPILSYLWLRGRCRYCKAMVPVRVFITEIATSLIFAGLYLIYGFGPGFIIMSVGVSVMLIVTLIDLEHRLIFPIVVYPAILALLILAPFWSELGFPREFFGRSGLLGSLLNSLASGFGAFLLFLTILILWRVFRSMEGVGGGDPGLAGLVGLLVGFPGVLVALWIAVVAGGVLAIFLVVFRNKGREDVIPFGPFLAAGGVIAFIAGDNLLARYLEFSANLIGS